MYNRCADPLTVVRERRERVAQDILRECLTPEVAEQMVALADGTQWEADGGVWLKRVRRPGGESGDIDADRRGGALLCRGTKRTTGGVRILWFSAPGVGMQAQSVWAP